MNLWTHTVSVACLALRTAGFGLGAVALLAGNDPALAAGSSVAGAGDSQPRPEVRLPERATGLSVPPGAEKIYYLGGELELDPTFNRGGDTLFLPRSIDNYSAYRSGSVLILLSDDGVIHIPVGSTGMELNFDGNVQVLRVNTATNLTMIGDMEITSISESDPDHLGDFNEVSIDRGTPAVAVTITLEDGTDHVLTEDANADTNVIVRGFDLGDIIQATGGTSDDYSFSRGDSDGDNVADDMTIIYRTASTDNLITIIDAFSASNSVIVYDFQTATQAFGGEFMTFA